MNIYEKNMTVLKETRPEIYDSLNAEWISNEEVLVGTALNEELFLVVQDQENLIPFGSSYAPSYEAGRYVVQFQDWKDDSRLFLFGFGNGMIVRNILDDSCPIQFCIVYEPSKAMFLKMLENFDIEDILRHRNLVLVIHDVNDEEFERFMEDIMDYSTWRTYSFASLYRYDVYYHELYCQMEKLYKKTIDRREAEMNTLIHFAECGMENEIKALKWMIDCQAFEDFQGKFSEDIPCIIVAAGPSLEKNVEVLKQAKGKSFILCVDTAIHFLLDRGIFPDMTCTIDSQKGTKYFTDERVKEIPIAVSLQSDYRALDIIGDVKPIYLSAENGYYHKLFEEKGRKMVWLEGGGSVATVCFRMALTLGFKTIILIGQDLAFTQEKSHAGQELTDGDFLYNIMMVDGYYGDKVLTREDFKSYIDWYDLVITENKDRTIINATEGGAKLKGAIQMPFQEVVNRYCKQDYDITSLIASVPQVWESYEEKKEYYLEIKEKQKCFYKDIKLLKKGIQAAERAIVLIQRKNYDPRELKRVEEVMSDVTDYLMDADEILILIKRIIKWDLEVSGELHNQEDELDKESLRLYQDVYNYYGHLMDSIEELLPIWKQTIEDINEKYHFEPSIGE